MKNLAWIVGLSSVVAFCAWSCGDDVETTPATAAGATTSSGSGGNGGASTTSTTSSMMMSSSTGMPCMFTNICEENCCHIQEDCAPATCALAEQFLMIDLTDCTLPQSECIANCTVDADCGAILSLISDPDPTLCACVGDCFPPCIGCAFCACNAELTACQGDTNCAAFLTCAGACTDAACFQNCAATNPGAATDAMVACAQTSCAAECLGQGGAGGTGGSGGN